MNLTGGESHPKAEKCTVDAFQGREEQRIIASLVVHRSLGFLKGPKRTCVMLSRATEQLVLVGDLESSRMQAEHLSTAQVYYK